MSPSPYKGLAPYDSADKDNFFGRDEEAEILVGKIFAYHMTLLFAATGVGKSSLLGAAVMPILTERERLDVVYYSSWIQDPLEGLKAAIKQTLVSNEKIGEKELRDTDALHPFLEACTAYCSEPLVVILDQLEELFQYHRHSEPLESFIKQVARVANDRALPVRLVFAMREDFLAELDIFQDKIPRPFENYYRLERLRESQAREAIERPAARAGFRVEASLVEALLQDLKHREAGPALRPDTQQGVFVEPPYLQIVCSELWRAEQHHPQRLLTLAQYEHLGGAERIVRGHFEQVMDALSLGEQALALEMFGFLVTSRGAKMAYRDEDLADPQLLGAPLDQLRPILQYLSGPEARILRSDHRWDGAWYELYHDVFAEIIGKWAEQLRADDERRFYLDIASATRKWVNAGREPSQLLRGARPTRGWRRRHAQALSAEEKDFLWESSKQYRRVLALRAALVLFVFAAIIAVGLAMQQTRLSQAEKDNQRSQNLMKIGLNERDKHHNTLKASHYFSKSALVTHDVGFAQNARLASAVLIGGIQLEAIEAHRGEGGPVFNVDGSRMLTWSPLEHTAWGWDQSLRQAFRLNHGGPVRGAIFSPQGGALMTWDDEIVQIWDAQGLPTLRLELGKKIWGARFSPDGARVLIWLSRETVPGVAEMWDLASERRICSLPARAMPIRGARFNADGSRVLLWDEANRVDVWDRDCRLALDAGLQPEGGVWGARFNPDGSWILTWSLRADKQGIAQLWDSGSGDLLRTLPPHQGAIREARFSPDGARVLTCSQDKTARLWDSRGGASVTVQHKAPIVGGRFSPDGARFLTWSEEDNTARLWVSVGGAPLGVVYHDHIRGAAFNADGSRLLTWGGDHLRREWSHIPPPPRLLPHERGAGALFSPKGDHILTWGDDGKVSVWSSTAGAAATPRRTFMDTEPVKGAQFSPDGRRLLVWNATGNVDIWAIDAGAPELSTRSALPHQKPVAEAAFSLDGKRVLTWSKRDKTVRLWDSAPAANAKPLATFTHAKTVKGARFSPDGKQLVTWDVDKTVRVWDIAAGAHAKPPRSFKQGEVLRGVRFSPDGSGLLIWSKDGSFRLWAHRDEEARAALVRGHDKEILEAVFSPDGERILTCSKDRAARVWDSQSLDLLTPALTHQEEVTGCAFSPNARQILTWSADRTARLWDSVTGDALTPPLGHGHRVRDAMFKPDGQQILTWSADGRAQVWDLRLDQTPPQQGDNLRLEVQTGTRLNEKLNELEVLPLDEWRHQKEGLRTSARHAPVKLS